MSLPPYEIEIKFTTGTRARLSTKQGEEAKTKRAEFFVLVVSGYGTLKDALLKEYPTYTTEQQKKAIASAIEQRSRLVGCLHSKLADPPAPDEIEPDINGYWVKEAL
ncbi:MAG: hypothetical protein ABIG98_06560 [Chloroflexota bacterium]